MGPRLGGWANGLLIAHLVCWLGKALPQWTAPAGLSTQSDSSPAFVGKPRTITFTTTEGTGMSLDVSADGKTIIFDLLGNLYTLPIAGGRARLLTSGMAFDAQPRSRLMDVSWRSSVTAAESPTCG